MDLTHLLSGNQFFAGAVGATIIGAVMVQLRSLPGLLWRFLLSQFTVELTLFDNTDGTLETFRHFDMWLSDQKEAKKFRRTIVGKAYFGDGRGYITMLTPGAGYFLVKEGKRHFLINREIEAKPDNREGRRVQTLHIRALGRNVDILRSLATRITEAGSSRRGVEVFNFTGQNYEGGESRLFRSLDTVYMDAKLKADIVGDVQTFLNTRAIYERRGTPYRRGYFLKGEPGTGKTSLVSAIATHFGLAIYTVNLSNVVDDAALTRAFSMVHKGVVLIEDIDAFDISGDRVIPAKVPGVGPTLSKGVSLTGLLNAIDGVGAGDGRLLFFTSNHPERLDKALLRPGRADRHYEIAALGPDEACEMFKVFYPDGDVTAFREEVAAMLPMPAADLQGYLLNSPEIMSLAKAA
jgi:chaperone BCS1